MKYLFCCFLLPVLLFGQPVSELVPWRKGNLWGYADREGRIIVEPQFDAAELFFYGRNLYSDGKWKQTPLLQSVAVVRKGGLVGLIDWKGRTIWPAVSGQWPEIFQIRDSVFEIRCMAAEQPDKHFETWHRAWLTNSGRLLGDFQFQFKKRILRGAICGNTDDGSPKTGTGELEPFVADDKMGLFSFKTGQVVLSPEWLRFFPMNDGLMLATKDINHRQKWVIGPSGRVLFQVADSLRCDDEFKNGRLKCHAETGFGYLDSTGRAVIPFQFWEAANFEPEGRAFVRFQEKGQLIDTAGQVLLEFGGKGRHHISRGRNWLFVEEADSLFYRYDWKTLKKQNPFGFKQEPQPIWLNGKMGWIGRTRTGWGLVDSEDKIVLPFEFESVGPFNTGEIPAAGNDEFPGEHIPTAGSLLQYKMHGKSGLIDIKTMKSVVETDFPWIGSLGNDSLFTVSKGYDYREKRTKSGVWHRTKGLVVPAIYKGISNRGGVIELYQNDGTMLLDSAGLRPEPVVEYITWQPGIVRRDGYALLLKNGRWGVIAWPDSAVLLPFEFDTITEPGDVLFLRKIAENRSFYYDLAQKRLTELPKGVEAIRWRFQEDRLAAWFSNGRLGFLDREFKMATPVVFLDVHDFQEGLAAVMQADSLWSFIRPNGQPAGIGKFRRADPFYKNRAVVLLENGREAVIDRSGRVLFSIESDWETVGRNRISAFHGFGPFATIASTDYSTYRSTALIDTTGRLLLEGCDDIFHAADSLFIVFKDDEMFKFWPADGRKKPLGEEVFERKKYAAGRQYRFLFNIAGLQDSSGNWLVKPGAHRLAELQEGEPGQYFIQQLADYSRLLDKNGKVILEGKFGGYKLIGKNLWLVERGSERGVFGENGQVLIPFSDKFSKLWLTPDGKLFAVSDKSNRLLGYFDETGRAWFEN